MFKLYGHFKTYSRPGTLADAGVIFFRNAAGQDFYDLQNSGLVGKQYYLVNPETNQLTDSTTDKTRLVPDDSLLVASDEPIQITDPADFVWNGSEIVPRPANPEEISAELAQTRFQAVLDGFPVACKSSVQAVLAEDYDRLDTRAVQRQSDGKTVGVEITGIYGSIDEGGLQSILTLTQFNNDCIAIGLPSIQTLIGSDAIDKDRFTNHLIQRFQFNAIYGRDQNYAWLPMSVEMWANRQWQSIKDRRDLAAHADVEFKATRFQAGPTSRANLAEVLTAVAGGWVLPGDYTWRDAGNTDVAMTLAELQQLARAMTTQKDAAYRASWASRSAIDAIVAGDDDDSDKIAAIKVV